MERLTVQNLTIWKPATKKYISDTEIVSDVSFSVNKGENFGILGPNGAGKSSILWSIAGTIPNKNINFKNSLRSPKWGDEKRLMDGNIYIDGIDVTYLQPGERGIGLIPQNLYLYPAITVKENISLALKVHGDKNYLEKVNAIAKRFKIDDILLKKPHQLSGGQQQRVAVARAIVKQPKLVLFDEALSSADPMSKAEFIPFIKSYLYEYQGSGLYVTHDPDEASLICDTIAILNNGIVQQIGTPSEIFRKPKNLFVAQFFSGFNTFVEGSFDSHNRLFITKFGDNLDLNDYVEKTGRIDSSTDIIGFRPSGFKITEKINNVISAEIIDNIFYNNSSCIRFKFNNHSIGIAAINDHKFHPGELINLEINPEHYDDLITFRRQ